MTKAKLRKKEFEMTKLTATMMEVIEELGQIPMETIEDLGALQENATFKLLKAFSFALMALV